MISSHYSNSTLNIFVVFAINVRPRFHSAIFCRHFIVSFFLLIVIIHTFFRYMFFLAIIFSTPISIFFVQFILYLSEMVYVSNDFIFSFLFVYHTQLCAYFQYETKVPNHASELVIGVLALICISVAIVACACCHRNKSGFKVSNQFCFNYSYKSNTHTQFVPIHSNRLGYNGNV